MFHIRLREMRLKRKLTQQKLSDEVGVALRTYQCYEQGKNNPSYDILLALSDVLDVSLDYLFCRDDFIKSREVVADE
jgi:Predicted transcriptional regulators